jgi:hypothetical protein
MECKNEIKIDGVDYVRKDSIKPVSQKNIVDKKGLTYCIIRTYSAGVFAGWINKSFKGMEATIYNSRRLFYWKGACSLSQLANEGVKNPSECQFAQVVAETKLTQIIEVIPITEIAKKVIDGVAIWQK